MDEKTSELRDLFVEATGAETVTERQAASRGTLADRDRAETAERVLELVATMRERYDFSTDLDDATYARIARGRFEEPDDEAIAAAVAAESGDADDTGAVDADAAADGAADAQTDTDAVELDAETVRAARLDLHLVRDSDREVDADFAYADLKRLTAEGASIVDCADALDADPDAVARHAAVARVDLTSTRANDRFRDGFRELLTDAEIAESHAAEAREDGLREATEDIETDVSF